MNTDKKQWFLWLDEARSPFMNMAVDELLLKNAESAPILRIYEWDRKAVSIGYVQSFTAAPQEGYTIVRRPTGGGVVFHDVDLTYTVVIPEGHEFCKLDRIESYHVFHRAVLRMLSEFGLSGTLSNEDMPPVDRATMQCFVTPTRYDVICGGKKYAGSAQRRTRDGILHQGSIMLEALGLDSKLVTEKLAKAFEAEFDIDFADYTPDENFLHMTEELAEEKYSTPEWNRKK